MKAAAIASDLGGDLTTLQVDLVRDVARIDLLAESVAQHIEVKGLFTRGGKRRACVDLLLSLIDRRLKLATTLGIERRARRVPTLSEVKATFKPED